MLLLHELSRTGAPKVALDIFDALPEIDLRVVATHGGPLETRCRQRASLRVLEPASRRWKHPLPLGARIRIKGQQLSASPFVRGFKPDLIYANSIESLHILRYVRLPNAPILCHVHELRSHLEPFAARLPQLFARPQKYIAVADCVSQALQKLKVPTEKIEIVHAFANADFASGIAKSSTRKDDVFVVGGAGTPIWRKGFSLWLQMAFYLRQSLGEQVKFVWVGFQNGFNSAQFQQEIENLGLQNAVELVSVTSNPQEHFRRFDVFAMTSWEDPCPLVVLENMLLQTPVACFAPSGGASEEVGDTGIVIDGFDPHAMAQQIASLLQDETRLKTLGERARHRVLDLFTAQTQVPKVARTMSEIVAKK